MITRSKYILLLFLLPSFSAFTQENCNYILKSGLEKIAVYDLDGQAELVYDTVTIPANKPFEIEKDWVLLPDERTDTGIITHIDYEINADTVLRIEVAVPLHDLVCIEAMEEAAREQFAIRVMETMYNRFYQENEQAGNKDKSLQDYSPETRSFFYHSFYWVEGYLGGAIIYDTPSADTWSRYLYTISNNVWGDSGEGRIRIAMLFAARPSLFLQAFKLINRTQNRDYIKSGIRDYFRKYLYEPVLRFENSESNRLFRDYSDKTPQERAISILKFYKPYLLDIGLTEQQIQALLT